MYNICQKNAPNLFPQGRLLLGVLLLAACPGELPASQRGGALPGYQPPKTGPGGIAPGFTSPRVQPDMKAADPEGKYDGGFKVIDSFSGGKKSPSTGPTPSTSPSETGGKGWATGASLQQTTATSSSSSGTSSSSSSQAQESDCLVSTTNECICPNSDGTGTYHYADSSQCHTYWTSPSDSSYAHSRSGQAQESDCLVTTTNECICPDSDGSGTYHNADSSQCQ
jgi:hypothetical protein